MSIHVNSGNIFVIIPAYNEHSAILPVVQQLLSGDYKIVIVDDGSSPDLGPLLKNAPVYFLRHPINLGQGAALQTGIDFCLSKNAEYVVTFDADGQHDSKDIETLLEVLIGEHLDIVLGSRFIKGAMHNMSVRRKVLLHLARYFNYFFTGLFLTDAHNGIRAMTQKAARAIVITENRMAHATEILSHIKRKKLRYAEVPVTVHYTDYSRQKGQTVWNSFRIFFDLLLNKIFR
jgi:polyprenyl-phospho-N-acetylgalactosaminyl synthase